ncbi:hypothetical protein CAPTEDRAFT_221111 [Capitella teleta]|uniref:Uncharacterized protein n=1 Tax=Capitella teleta TaxID=283909 RepID=R7VBX3_CAPTE|nr:hypothetical protein CAPTEDRAFT_221111 [Capitella teleta]|eukprot:ELU16343.1 hypothetical protein CAPTEDRAFT_221111 [Capitella teleta]
MVGSNTEYRRSFKEGNFRCSSRTFETNFDYRHDRRVQEHHHNSDVYTWDDDDSSDSESSSTSCHSIERPASVPAHKLKHQKLVDLYAKKLTKTQDIQVRVPGTTSPDNESFKPNLTNSITPPSDRHLRHYPKEQQQKSDGSKVCRSVQVSPSLESSAKPREQRPKKPSPVLIYSQKKFVPKPKKFPAEVARPLRSDKGPFLSYGCEDKELTTGSKKTHNIRASADVHASAIRAAERRKAAVEQMAREGVNSPCNQRSKKAIQNNFNEWMKKETNAWDTEYRRCFVGYEPNMYSRVLSARMNPGKHWAGERLIASA